MTPPSTPNPALPSLTCALGLLLWAAIPTSAETIARYIDVNYSGMDVSVSINGFKLHQSEDSEGGAYSSFLGQVLHDGKNEIEWSAVPRASVANDAKPGWVEVEVMEAPADAARNSENPGKALYAERTLPLNSFELLPARELDRTTISGDFNQESGTAIFRQIEPRRWAWGMQINDPEQRISGRPTILRHAVISESLVLAELHLLMSGTDRHAVIDGLKLPRGGGELSVTKEMVQSGAQFLDGGEFDTVWIFGTAAEGVEKLSLSMLTIETIKDSYQVRSTFEVDVAQTWAWQQGDELGDLTNDPAQRKSLVDFLRELHQAVNSSEVERWTPFFETKLSEMTKVSGQDAAVLRESQLKFFESLTSMEEWKLQPFDESRLLFRKINPQVIQVRYVNSEGPIQSVPLPKPGEPGKLDRVTIPLYLASIDGQWTIVR